MVETFLEKTIHFENTLANQPPRVTAAYLLRKTILIFPFELTFFDVPASWRSLGKPRCRGNLHLPPTSFRMRRLWTPEGSSFHCTGTDEIIQIDAGPSRNGKLQAPKKSWIYWIPFKTSTLRKRGGTNFFIWTYVFRYLSVLERPRKTWMTGKSSPFAYFFSECDACGLLILMHSHRCFSVGSDFGQPK